MVYLESGKNKKSVATSEKVSLRTVQRIVKNNAEWLDAYMSQAC